MTAVNIENREMREIKVAYFMNQHDGLKIQERKEKAGTCTCRSRKYGQNIYVMMGERRRKLEEIAA